MGKEWMALQSFNNCHHTIMATDSKVVPLANVMGQDDSGGCADSGEHGQEHAALQGLSFIDDHKGVMQGTSADVGQR